MKKLMMMAWTVAAVGLFAAPTKQTLIATAELAPFADITPAVSALGTMMNNPMMPTLVVGMAQQGLTQKYGRLRAASPMFLQVYLADDAIKNLKLDAEDPFKDKGDAVLVYPIDETEAAFMQKRGAKKAADGTIYLAKGEEREQEAWVKFSADGKFCVFAQSPALAALAVEDFAKRPAPKAGAKTHLFRMDLREAGLSALLAVIQKAQNDQQQTLLAADKSGSQFNGKLAEFNQLRNEMQLKILNSFSGAALSLDLDDYGISVNGVLRRKPGAQAPEAGVILPAGALDQMPVGANCFVAYNRMAHMAGECTGPDDFAKLKGAMVSFLQSIPAAVAEAAAKDADLKKYEGFVNEVVAASGELLGSIAYPQRGDWDSFAIGFDAQKHPAIICNGQAATAKTEYAAACKFLDRLLGACQRQWPKQKFLVKRGTSAFAIDWMALLDFVVAECKSETPANPKEIAKIKKNTTGILGGTTTELVISANGKRTTLAAQGVKVATGAGEARFAAAVPEVAKARPDAVFYLTPYAFARDVLLPVMAKFADKAEDRQQFQSMQAALPPASSKGALAGAAWARNDGSVRFLLRLTADEVKSFGAVVGALGSTESDDDDDDDTEK